MKSSLENRRKIRFIREGEDSEDSQNSEQSETSEQGENSSKDQQNQENDSGEESYRAIQPTPRRLRRCPSEESGDQKNQEATDEEGEGSSANDQESTEDPLDDIPQSQSGEESGESGDEEGQQAVATEATEGESQQDDQAGTMSSEVIEGMTEAEAAALLDSLRGKETSFPLTTKRAVNAQATAETGKQILSMHRFKFTLLLLPWLLALSTSAEISVTAIFNPPRIALGDKAQYVLEIKETSTSQQPK